jgi:transcriptional regulator with XRE-family HTH domain
VPDQSTTGSRIRLTRNHLLLSLPELAGQIAVQRKTLENWESDRSEPRGDKLMKLAGVLQVPMVWLLTGDTPQGSDRKLGAPKVAKVAQKLERALAMQQRAFAMQQDLATLLAEVSADVMRLQRELDEDRELAA